MDTTSDTRKKHGRQLKKSHKHLKKKVERSSVDVKSFSNFSAETEENIMESSSDDDIKLFSELVGKSAQGIIPPGVTDFKKNTDSVKVTKKRNMNIPQQSEKKYRKDKLTSPKASFQQGSKSYATKEKLDVQDKMSSPLKTKSKSSLFNRKSTQMEISDGDQSYTSEEHSDEVGDYSEDETNDKTGKSSEIMSGTSESEEDASVAKRRFVGSNISADAVSPAKSSTEEDVEDMASLREKLSHVPFEDLQKLKEKIGVKTYNEVMFGKKVKVKTSMATKQDKRDKQVYKRASKDRPVEMSSKVPVSRRKPKTPMKKKVHRDPRFDNLSGEYNDVYFKKDYGFIDDIKKREKLVLLDELKEEKDVDRRKKIKYLIHRMTQQEKEARKDETKKTNLNQWKNLEREKIKTGKKPFYLKESEKKKLELADKYRELKKSGKVEKYLSKKRKKNASKDKRKLPKHVFS